jgi:hypothetical protein
MRSPLLSADQEIREMVIKNFNDAINKDWFKILILYLDDIREDHIYIIKELNKIINDIQHNIPLNGKCELCPEEDSLWWYIWQHIKK